MKFQYNNNYICLINSFPYFPLNMKTSNSSQFLSRQFHIIYSMVHFFFFFQYLCTFFNQFITVWWFLHFAISHVAQQVNTVSLIEVKLFRKGKYLNKISYCCSFLFLTPYFSLYINTPYHLQNAFRFLWIQIYVLKLMWCIQT